MTTTAGSAGAVEISLSTPTSSLPSSSASSPFSSAPSATSTMRRSKITTFLLSLTIACCLLASTSSSSNVFCSALPVTKNVRQHQQRSIAQQVHHVQIADESVHITRMLIKKSIQRRKLQKIQLQQKEKAAKVGRHLNYNKEKRHGIQKRNVWGEELPTATVASVVEADDNVDAQASEASTSSLSASSSNKIKTTIAMIKKRIGTGNKYTSKGTQKSQSARRLVSAYEAIVFSESQIPVFLSQKHQRQLQRSRKSPASSSSPRKAGQKKRQIMAAANSCPSLKPTVTPPSPADDLGKMPFGTEGDRDTDLAEKKEGGRKNSKVTQVQDYGEPSFGVVTPTSTDSSNKIDKNSLADHCHPVSNDAQVHEEEQQQRDQEQQQDTHQEVMHDQRALSAIAHVSQRPQHGASSLHSNPSSHAAHLSSSDCLHSKDRNNTVFVVQGCMSSPMIALGVLSMALLASYKLYVRMQRRVAVSYTLLPSSHPSSASFPTDAEAKNIGHSTPARHSQP